MSSTWRAWRSSAAAASALDSQGTAAAAAAGEAAGALVRAPDPSELPLPSALPKVRERGGVEQEQDLGSQQIARVLLLSRVPSLSVYYLKNDTR